ncbi:MAG: toll/interleukin-1 receptor domain-containing protein [Nitrospira sp.]|nr:toll/interleukin-1 receptor domain-containing protein [Nitrospira sp.]
MGESVLVFISHSSENKSGYIESIVQDLEACFINVWIDKRKIVPGDNLRKSIFRDGIDKADVVLIFFTEQSLSSSWVDREIKHVLREETKKGSSFDLRKVISIFDSTDTYDQIAEKYPELTDDLLHLMPLEYGKIELGKLVSAIWSKYLSLQGGDIETQKQLLAKERAIFQSEKAIQKLEGTIRELKNKTSENRQNEEFEKISNSGAVNSFIERRSELLKGMSIRGGSEDTFDGPLALGFIKPIANGMVITEKGRDFLAWLLLTGEENDA